MALWLLGPPHLTAAGKFAPSASEALPTCQVPISTPRDVPACTHRPFAHRSTFPADSSWTLPQRNCLRGPHRDLFPIQPPKSK